MRLYDRDGRKAEGQLQTPIVYFVTAREPLTSVEASVVVRSSAGCTMPYIASNDDAITV